MKMLKYVVMVDNDVKTGTEIIESERIFVRELNEKYGKENVLKVIDVTNKNVLCNLPVIDFLQYIYNVVENYDKFNHDTALFVQTVLKNALKD